jgi:hypothetical protein
MVPKASPEPVENVPVASGAPSRMLLSGQPILGIRIPEMQVEEVARLAADGEPLIRARTYTGNIYSLDLR